MEQNLVMRFVQFFLSFDGVLHILEVISAIEEGATRTAILTGFHAIIFFIAVFFIGHEHKHNRPQIHENPVE